MLRSLSSAYGNVQVDNTDIEYSDHFLLWFSGRSLAVEPEWTRARPTLKQMSIIVQVNKKFWKFERKYRDCIKRKGDKIGTQTCYVIST